MFLHALPQKRIWRNNIFLLTTLLGYALRLYKLGEQSLWYDETVSAFLAHQPTLELVAHTARDIHPPGYYLLLHYWAIATGNSEFALAYFSLIFGVLLISLTYQLARHLINQTVALWAALLVAISPFNIWYSQEVRMYTLGAVLGVMTAYFLYRAMASPHATRYWIGYVATAVAGLYTLYYFAFLLIVLNLVAFFFILRQANSRIFSKSQFRGARHAHVPSEAARGRAGSSSHNLFKLLLANGIVFILYLPWLPIAWRQATNPPVPPWRSPPQIWQSVIESWSALSLGQSVEPHTIWPFLLFTLALFIVGLRYLWSYIHPYHPVILATYTFGTLLLIYMLSFITPLYHVRYIFTYSPPFYIIVAAGLVWLTTKSRYWVALVSFGLLGAASIYSIYQLHFDAHNRADDYRAAVAFIMDRWQPGDVILTNAGYTYTAFDFYANDPIRRRRLVPYQSPGDQNTPLVLQSGTIDGDSTLGWNDPRSDFYAMSATETTAALEQLSTDFSRLWMLRAYDTVTDPQGLIRSWLAENAILLEDQPFSGESNIRAQGFLLKNQPPLDGQQIPFEDGMVLAAWLLPQQNWLAGQTIPVKLWWTTTTTPGADYKLSLKIWSPAGELVAQGQDEWPAGSLYRATDWPPGEIVYHPTQITLPTPLPDGQYWLNAELYHPETIQPLPRRDNGDPFVTLGPITVVTKK